MQFDVGGRELGDAQRGIEDRVVENFTRCGNQDAFDHGSLSSFVVSLPDACAIVSTSVKARGAWAAGLTRRKFL